MKQHTYTYHPSEDLTAKDLRILIPIADDYVQRLLAIDKNERLQKIASFLREVFSCQSVDEYTSLEAVFIMRRISETMYELKPHPKLDAIITTLIELDTPLAHMVDTPETLWEKLQDQITALEDAVSNQ